MLFSAMRTVETPPDDACAERPLLQVFHPDLLLRIIALPYEAPTPDPRLTPPRGEASPERRLADNSFLQPAGYFLTHGVDLFKGGDHMKRWLLSMICVVTLFGHRPDRFLGTGRWGWPSAECLGRLWPWLKYRPAREPCEPCNPSG